MRLAFILLALFLSRAATAGEPQSRHWLVHISMEKGVFRLVRVTEVALPLPKVRSGAEIGSWKAVLLDDRDRKVHSLRLLDPTELRGEFEDPSRPGRIQAVRTRMPEPVHFTVRVPAGAGQRLVFYALDAEAVRQAEPGDADWKKLGEVRLDGKE
jgi:hypothetical protein